jgi:hypothetical protein
MYQTWPVLSDHGLVTGPQQWPATIALGVVTYDEAIGWLRESDGALHLSKTAAGYVVSAKVGTSVARRITRDARSEAEVQRLQLEVIEELRSRLEEQRAPSR